MKSSRGDAPRNEQQKSRLEKKASSNWQTRDDMIVLMSHIGAHWRLSILIHGQDKEGAEARGDC